VDHLTFFGPVFFDASFLEIFPATALGLQAGYGRLDLLAELRPHGLPVLTSVHCSPNHLPKPPFLLGFFDFVGFAATVFAPTCFIGLR